MMKKLKLLQKSLKNTKHYKYYKRSKRARCFFGSVTRDIANEIKIDDIEVSAKDVIVKSIIKNIGEFQVKIVLHPEVFKEIV